MSKRLLNAILCCTALIIGGLLYIIFRETTYVATLFKSIEVLSSIRKKILVLENAFLMYYLPDFLWGFSLSCGLTAIFNPSLKGIILCSFTAFMCGTIWEILQYSHILSGTGDFADILMYLAASALAVIINSKGVKL